MTLGQILFELRVTQMRTDRRMDGRTKVNLNTPYNGDKLNKLKFWRGDNYHLMNSALKDN
jgi:hypothetical protein